MIRKWLAAGVLKRGMVDHDDEGTPQGGNIAAYRERLLHYVFDLWVHQWREARARGEMTVVRFADDFVLGFQYEADAVRFRADLRALSAN